MKKSELFSQTREAALKSMIKEVADINKANGWFDTDRSFGDDIALLHSEVSEAFEGYRNNNWSNVEEEMADIFIRLLDTCYRHGIPLYQRFEEKCVKNAERGYKHGGKIL